MNTDDPDLEDTALLASLADALGSSRHPRLDLIVANAQDAFSITALDDELARLVYDSDLMVTDSAPTRAGSGGRTIMFECEALEMEIEVRGGFIVGQIAPPGPAGVSLHSPDGHLRSVEADELGCFIMSDAPAGRLRFRVSRPGSSAVTEWTHLRLPSD